MNEEISLNDLIKNKNIFDNNNNGNHEILIEDLNINDIIELEGKVISKKLQQTKNGKEFLLFTISDKSSSIRVIDWYNPEKYFNDLVQGKVVKIKGKVVSFANRLQINLSREEDSLIILNENEINKDKFISKKDLQIDLLTKILFDYINQIKNVNIKKFLNELFEKETILREDFFESPAAMTIHHAYIGGLLEHTIKVIDVSLKLNESYNNLANKDILISASIFHDIGKIKEYIILPHGIDKTDNGELHGHIYLGVEMFNKLIEKYPYLNCNDKNHIIHIILSHHGEIEYGSPVLPKTIEAFIVHLADYFDSRLSQVCQNIDAAKKIDPNSSWTEYDKRLGTKLKTDL